GETEDADHRRRVDVRAVGLVVERDVPTDDGDAERLTRPGDALHHLDELPHHLWLLWIAQVQVVHGGERPGAGDGDVQRRLPHQTRRAATRVEEAESAVAVGGDRQTLPGPCHAEQRTVVTGA